MAQGKANGGKSAETETRLLKAAFNSVREYVAVTNLDGRILESNTHFSAFFGSGGLKSALSSALDSSAESEAFRKWIDDAMKNGASATTGFHTKTGRYLECRMKPLKAAGGKPFLCWLLQDISENDRIKRKLEALNSDLERRIAKRTADLEAESERSRRLESIVREVDERERARLGRDIHDMVGQTLTALAMRTEVLKNRLVIEGSEHSLDAASILDNIKVLMDQTRSLSRQLFPVALESRGIDEALIELANSLRVSLGLDCACRFSGQQRIGLLDAEMKINIFRICQEAVSNAVKHGKAKSVEISLKLESSAGLLTISNNGLPIPAAAGGGDGIGMSIMKSRAEILGGTLSISKPDSPGKVKVKCRFPLKAGKIQ